MAPHAVVRLVVAFFAVALLLVPIFAHGCHGDDVDHEPLLVPHHSHPEPRP